MTQSHIQQNLPLKNQVIPIDDKTTHLFHYDITVNDVLKGVAPVDSPVYTLTSQGYYGGGVAIEEATTNLWTGNYIVYNNHAMPNTIVNTGEFYNGMPIWRIGMTPTDQTTLTHYQTTLNSHGVYGGTIPWVQNTMYVSSIYWRPVNKFDMVFGGVASNTNGWVSGGNEIQTDGWRRFYRYRTGVGVETKTDAVHHSFYCPSLKLNETIYFEICGAQTEQGRITPTSYIPNGTSRAAGKLYYPIPIAPPATISFWVKPLVPNNYAITVNWILGQNPYKNDMLIWKRTTENYYRVRVGDSDVALSPSDINAFTWSQVAVVFDMTETRVYINGNLKGTCGVLAPAPVLTLGSAQGYETGNNIFDELRIDKVARTSDEILSWYYSNSPFWPKGIYKVGY